MNILLIMSIAVIAIVGLVLGFGIAALRATNRTTATVAEFLAHGVGFGGEIYVMQALSGG